MIEIYTRDGCNGCSRIKQLMNYYGVPYVEHKLDVDISSQNIKNLFPESKQLPILVTDSGEVYSGPKEAEKMLNEYKNDFGKDLLWD